MIQGIIKNCTFETDKKKKIINEAANGASFWVIRKGGEKQGTINVPMQTKVTVGGGGSH